MEKLLQEIRTHAIAYIAGKYMIPAHQAEDIAQQAILEYLKALKEKDIESPKAYIMATCRNMAVSCIRRAKSERKQQHRLESYYEKMMRSYGMQYEDPQEMIDEWRRVLPPKYAALLEELSRCPTMAELAQKMDMNYNTVKSQIYTIKTYIEVHNLVQEGYIISTKLLNRYQKDAVLKFLRQFNCFCRDKHIPRNSRYFSNINYSEIDMDYEIIDIIKLEYNNYEPQKYEATVGYKDSMKKVGFFYFMFTFNQHGLSLIQAPKKYKIRKLSKEEVEEAKRRINYTSGDRKREYSKQEDEIIKEIGQRKPISFKSDM